MPRLSPPRKRGAVSYGDVTSANIVGYQLIPVPEGFSLFCPTFKGVGGRLDLSTIDICTADGAINTEIYGMVSLQQMNAQGGYIPGTYLYDKDSYPDNGWENPSHEEIKIGELTFAEGEGVCINNDFGETVYIRVSGEVDLINRNEVGEGYILWGNSTPVALDLCNLNVVDVDGEINLDIYGAVSIQFMNAQGGYIPGTYLYDKDSYPDNGWENPSHEEIAPGEKVLQPGEAVCINNDFGETVWMNPRCPISK